MKSTARQLLIVLAAALVLYFAFFWWIEHRRTSRGPWEVTFTARDGFVGLVINQPALKIQNATIHFAGATLSSNIHQTLRFDRPRSVPFDVPPGRCVFMDTTFQPGNVTLQVFGHEIQLLPRVLTVDFTEYDWKQATNMVLQPPHPNRAGVKTSSESKLDPPQQPEL